MSECLCLRWLIILMSANITYETFGLFGSTKATVANHFCTLSHTLAELYL